MRRPAQIERLYLDFDGFFASVEQQAHPHLRGRPVGVVPFAEARHTCVIACSREAKLRGVKNVMPIAEARERCPEIILVPQSPDLYRRAHNALISEISAVIPVDAVKSIDELTCRVAVADRDRKPWAAGSRRASRTISVLISPARSALQPTGNWRKWPARRASPTAIWRGIRRTCQRHFCGSNSRTFPGLVPGWSGI
jgi:nucleotidyltransferase/DNA polymerase involved in DNA repair